MIEIHLIDKIAGAKGNNVTLCIYLPLSIWNCPANWPALILSCAKREREVDSGSVLILVSFYPAVGGFDLVCLVDEVNLFSHIIFSTESCVWI